MIAAKKIANALWKLEMTSKTTNAAEANFGGVRPFRASKVIRQPSNPNEVRILPLEIDVRVSCNTRDGICTHDNYGDTVLLRRLSAKDLNEKIANS
jgi:hypothetical protein